jgi:hexosaminidase
MITKTTRTKFFILFVLISVGFSCKNSSDISIKSDLSLENLIPKPLTINSTKGNFVLNSKTVITTTNNKKFKTVGTFLAEKLNLHNSLNLVVDQSTTENVISINKTSEYPLSSKESYQLLINKNAITINASTDEGAFRAVQTLRQLILIDQNNTSEWLIPTGEILDEPSYGYRGSMLDVARHFFPIEDIKKYIDALAYYKMNVLHLHLSDDQGWRLEIKSWPDLTHVGGHTQVGGEKGGFYTQEDYTEIVNYAVKHYITVIPEIDMPGHTYAASVAYPFLNGAKKFITALDNPTPDRRSLLYTGIDVGFSTFDARKETTYEFIDDVIREVAALTPGPYFHMGGDESHVTSDEDYDYFVERVGEIVRKYDKRMIGWDEVARVDKDSNSVVQFWSKEENAKMAKEKGMKIIMSPAKRAYLDMKYDTLSKFGLHWAAYIPVDVAYNWTPEKYAAGISKENILGVEAPLWSETVSNIEELEYLAFPRVIGIAEVGWSTEENRDWENYRERLGNQTPYLNQMNIKYYPSKLIDWKE